MFISLFYLISENCVIVIIALLERWWRIISRVYQSFFLFLLNLWGILEVISYLQAILRVLLLVPAVRRSWRISGNFKLLESARHNFFGGALNLQGYLSWKGILESLFAYVCIKCLRHDRRGRSILGRNLRNQPLPFLMHYLTHKRFPFFDSRMPNNRVNN